MVIKASAKRGEGRGGAERLLVHLFPPQEPRYLQGELDLHLRSVDSGLHGTYLASLTPSGPGEGRAILIPLTKPQIQSRKLPTRKGRARVALGPRPATPASSSRRLDGGKEPPAPDKPLISAGSCGSSATASHAATEMSSSLLWDRAISATAGRWRPVPEAPELAGTAAGRAVLTRRTQHVDLHST